LISQDVADKLKQLERLPVVKFFSSSYEGSTSYQSGGSSWVAPDFRREVFDRLSRLNEGGIKSPYFG
jgi:hypothetical protein